MSRYEPAISPVAFNPAASLNALANFFCRATTTPTASQYSFRTLRMLSRDLQDLWMSVLSARGGAAAGVAMLGRYKERDSALAEEALSASAFGHVSHGQPAIYGMLGFVHPSFRYRHECWGLRDPRLVVYLRLNSGEVEEVVRGSKQRSRNCDRSAFNKRPPQGPSFRHIW